MILKHSWIDFVIEAAEQDQKDTNSSMEEIDAAVSKHVTNPPLRFYAI